MRERQQTESSRVLIKYILGGSLNRCYTIGCASHATGAVFTIVAGGTEPPASDLNTDTADTIGGALNHDNKESAADSLSTDTQDTSAFSFEIPGGSDSDADVQIDASQGVVGGAPGPSRGVRGKFARPPQKLMKAIMHAVSEWGMIQQGDRICLGLSGGKDSLALLHCLVELQKRFPPGACAVLLW